MSAFYKLSQSDVVKADSRGDSELFSVTRFRALFFKIPVGDAQAVLP
jgi:hypothetical protein